jgi:hypothetical protein
MMPDFQARVTGESPVSFGDWLCLRAPNLSKGAHE